MNQSANRIMQGDNLEVLREMESGSVELIYVDPPFNTGTVQARKTLRAVRDQDGERTGFAGRRYRTTLLSESSYLDHFDDYLAFLAPRLGRFCGVLESVEHESVAVS